LRIEIRKWTHPQPAHLAVHLSVISDQSATLQMSKVTGDARHGHTNAGSQLVRTATLRLGYRSYPSSRVPNESRLPGNLFPGKNFPGINNPNYNNKFRFTSHLFINNTPQKLTSDYLCSMFDTSNQVTFLFARLNHNRDATHSQSLTFKPT